MASVMERSRGTVGAWGWLAVGLLVMAVSGCWGTGSNQAVVSGTVTLGGEPLTKGTINFASASHTGSATIDDRGRYTVTLPFGEYKVGVVAIEMVSPKGGGPQALMGMPVPKSLVPSKYSDVATSGLNAAIGKGNKKVDFDLKP